MRAITTFVWQDAFDEIELLFPDNLDRLDQNSTQEIHQLHITTFPLSKRFRIDEKVNTIDDSNRDIFSIVFLSRKHIKNILRHSIYLYGLVLRLRCY